MDFEAILTHFDVYNNLLAFLLGIPRILLVFSLAPFFASTIVTGQLRITIAISIYLLLHPMILESLPEWQGFSLSFVLRSGVLLAKEILIGFFLAFLAGMPFWAAEGAGFFIDNQRGASMAQLSDSMTGNETSPMGSFMVQSIIYMFFASGAFLAFLGILFASYEIWSVNDFLPQSIFSDIKIPIFFASKVALLMKHIILLAGPIALACLLTDISLGLINRFASQLNVYVLAMPIKSAIACFMLLIYYTMILSGVGGMFAEIGIDFQTIKSLFPK